MRLYQQLVLFMLAATVLPLAAVGFLVLSRAERELAERISAEQRALATATAEGVAAELMETVDAVARVAELIDWQSATEEEARGALALLYNQSSALSAVLRLDSEGRPQGQPVFQAEGGGGHPGFDPQQVELLTKAVPVQPLRHGGKGEAALGRVYAHESSGMAAVAVAVKLDQGEGASFVLAEIVFRNLEDLLRRRAEGVLGTIDLVDPSGRILASSDPQRRMKGLDAAIATRLTPGGALAAHSFRAGDPVLRVSVARVPEGLGFDVVLSVSEADALAPVRSMRRTVLISIGGALLVLLGLGGLFTRRINRRLSEVMAGAQAFGRGELDRRVKVEGGDELSELATTFNHMGAELETARARLMRWNDDLRIRVDEALAELRTAQAQLVETQKLAAVGQLGAGVAHELNNPLAGILGYVQLMLMSRPDSDPDLDMLRKIEGSAKRCKEITQNLLRFSQQRERTDLRAVNLNVVVRDALTLTENQVKAEGISLVLELASSGVRVMADSGQTSQAILALVSNARTAMQKTSAKTLTVRTGERDGKGYFEVEDTGKGIAPEHRSRIFEPFFTTKDVWSNVGLGLSVTYRVVTEAGGSIDVRSEPGKGSCFTVWLTKA
ncbi:sensor histidine kinase [Stigmatella aurantiaca]|uniref:histidine kinase n=1 Tax=Stigmatella aurantiaca (strain DW4/3-1) TaxID=378806 RepID=Q08Y95_STIAD|nr:ATP-binding protein [Stigmatella aurantiaca]ADO72578.1 Sensor protein [Stigmatella aurantiaca DW4/3-1]EAU65462.1 histidine kinase HsfB [Stigmatella aurantiaca DW4/3-1]